LDLIWVNSVLPAASIVCENDEGAMPLETALILFAIAIPFAVFAAALAWADRQTSTQDH
jgi:multisubunit Na+/H+ antiporter MnhC subunit